MLTASEIRRKLRKRPRKPPRKLKKPPRKPKRKAKVGAANMIYTFRVSCLECYATSVIKVVVIVRGGGFP